MGASVRFESGSEDSTGDNTARAFLTRLTHLTRVTMLCSVAGKPPPSEGRLRVRGGGGMTHNHAGGIGLALKPTCLPPPLRFGWPVT